MVIIMIKKISRLLTEYKVQRIKLDENTNFKILLKSILSSLLINIVLFLIPALLIYNLFIIDKIILLLKLLIIVLIVLFAFSYNYFVVKLIKLYEEKLEPVSFKVLIVFESIIASIFLVIIAIVIMTIV